MKRGEDVIAICKRIKNSPALPRMIYVQQECRASKVSVVIHDDVAAAAAIMTVCDIINTESTVRKRLNSQPSQYSF